MCRRLDLLRQPNGIQPPLPGDPIHLGQRCIEGQMGIEAGGGAGQQGGDPGFRLRPGRRCGKLGPQRRAHPQVASAATYGGEIAGGGAGVEVVGPLEFLGQQGAADHLLLGVGEQAAVGLPGEEQLGQPGDGQRICHPQQQGQGQQGSDCYHDFLLQMRWVDAGLPRIR